MKTASIIIKQTTNYELFHSNPHQRAFKHRKVKVLMEKMKANGFPPSMAISVYKSKEGTLVINAGHHRIAAAQALRIPVLYVIEHQWTNKELSDEGSVNTTWSMKDHVANYAKDGNADYDELLRLQKLGISVNQATALLIGQSATSHNATEALRDGKFKIKTRKYTALWESMREELVDRVPCITHRSFINAWSKCLFTPEFDQEVFLKRLRANPKMIDVCANEAQMLEMIEDVYNFKAGSKIPLAFLVTQNNKDRFERFTVDKNTAQ
jgi:hypothetical protein